MKCSFIFRLSILSIMFVLSTYSVSAQTDFEKFRQKQQEQFNQFRKKKHDEYDAFRKRINDEYADFVERIWNEYRAFKGIPVPEEPKPVPPIVMPEEDKDEPIEDYPVVIEEVVEPIVVEPQPEPIKPIEPEPEPAKVFKYLYYGTSMEVRLDDSKRFTLKNTDESSVANVWRTMGDGRFDATIVDCLDLRKKYHLDDWAYLQMLNKLSEEFWKTPCNEASLMLAYIYWQSGYKMRLAKSGNRIVMLFATKHQLFEHPYFTLDGDDDYYYAMDKEADELYISQASFPAEKSLSLCIKENPLFETEISEQRKRKSKNSGLEFLVESEENLLVYYSAYPTSMLNDNPMTRWAMYANTPLSKTAEQRLYPNLKNALQGLTKTEKVVLLLDWVQTAFEYEYDDKVWGEDRAFFADESLYYPYCDCEDRSILFTRLVRDLVGLPCILVYYPGHLAAAVCFDKHVNGDYIMLGNKRFTVCDPTYINAPIGATMPNMDNSSAKVILLE